MEIIKGKLASAKKVVVYGPEGIGKSTFASQKEAQKIWTWRACRRRQAGRC